MTVREYLSKKHKPTDVIYLGGAESSGFFFIGIAACVPIEYMDTEIIMTYPHMTDHPGMTILVDSHDVGKYWFWYECDSRVSRPTCILMENERTSQNDVLQF